MPHVFAAADEGEIFVLVSPTPSLNASKLNGDFVDIRVMVVGGRAREEGRNLLWKESNEADHPLVFTVVDKVEWCTHLSYTIPRGLEKRRRLCRGGFVACGLEMGGRSCVPHRVWREVRQHASRRHESPAHLKPRQICTRRESIIRQKVTIYLMEGTETERWWPFQEMLTAQPSVRGTSHCKDVHFSTQERKISIVDPRECFGSTPVHFCAA